ncbi:acetyl-coenzyme A synthetase, putative [Cryptosporidium muris RN66]|uniref:Acetyl-coenzyme A synthetase n=1 Tax=Cryptosporidium muris (strain RN66) TaxID=441375 RepID=B6AJA7_CRYMR|nr:acetyl-coenzyme A synthetase, putative [Cryptosporidium muris RN66]EEA08245.1 acetyl-coenzyme A synthetase, putative [Cryptosporidium muris RN66]|eukprot:XP_002142594.1 acetyl-coenzyme A synthetase [Cryptosporidium muris RN66]
MKNTQKSSPGSNLYFKKTEDNLLYHPLTGSSTNDEEIDLSSLMENVDTVEYRKKSLPFHESYDPPSTLDKPYHISDINTYYSMYERSISDPDAFWSDIARQHLRWIRDFTQVQSQGPEFQDRMFWFINGKLNVCDNCVDRWAEEQPDTVALIWEGDNPDCNKKITYMELFRNVCKMANVLKRFGIKKGDSVGIYMPMIPETIYTMLACARIGAVHMVVFAGFAARNLLERLINAKCKIVVTADQGIRGNKIIPLKDIVDEALEDLHEVHTCIVFKHLNGPINVVEGRDYDGNALMRSERSYCPLEEMDSEDPLFYLYTSGSTGTPKGVQHSTAGYLLFAAITQKYLFDTHKGDIFGCVGDIGWITGHSYLVYASLCNGLTTLIFEGVPTYPDPGRYWEIVQKYKITHFYTAPTALRALKRFGDEYVKKYDRSSLRILGSVGEPINPSAWRWYRNIVGDGRCPIVDTYWQTETGGIVIAPIPGCVKTKPGSSTLPFFGIKPVILNPETGVPIEGVGSGVLCIQDPWPGMFRSIFGAHYLHEELYTKPFPGYYFSGDGAMKDSDGYYWITGRVDDTINVAGHRLSSKEIEDSLTNHESVSEAAAVAVDHDVKGYALVCFIVLRSDHFHSIIGESSKTPNIEHELRQCVRKQIGPVASPDHIVIVDGIPKTRSGKVVRRLLRKIASGSTEYGDISTVTNPECIESIVNTWNKYFIKTFTTECDASVSTNSNTIDSPITSNQIKY